MNYTQIIFSPTGGTQKVADAMTINWQDKSQIDLTVMKSYEEYSFSSEDLVLIAMPSFGGLAPQIALDRIGQMKGNSARCIIVAVYGNRAYEDTLVQMEDVAEKSGFQVVAAVAAVAEHSILRQFAKGRPDVEDARELAEYMLEIMKKIENKNLTKPQIPGNRPYKKSGNFGMVPKAGAACDRCGLCAKQCPVGAIDLKEPQNVEKQACISCMRCVMVCPKQCRKLNGALLTAASLTLKKACSGRKINELFL